MAINHNEYYTACNLKENPFRALPVQDADPRMNVWAGYEKEKDTLLKFLTRTRNDQVGNINFLLIYGEYGIGKSHAMLWSKHYIQKSDEFNSLVFYVPTLKKENGRLSFAGVLRYDIVEKSHLLEQLMEFKHFLDHILTKFKDVNNLPQSTSKDECLKRIVQSYDLLNFAKKLFHCETELDIRNLILPDKVIDYQAVIIFSNIVNLVTYRFNIQNTDASFKKAAFLFIDETDLLVDVSAKEQREANELFRHLYDYCPSAFCLVLGLTGSAAEIPIMFAPYVLSRITRQIVLTPMNPNEAKEFIRKILDGERENNDSLTGYYPFSESAIDLIVGNLVAITPRKIITTMQQVLEEVRLIDFKPSRNNLITREFLDEKEVVVDILG